MARLFLRRTLAGWSNADDASQEAARRFKVGETYKAEIVRPRSLKTLGRYWVLVQMIMDNTDMFPSKEVLHQYLKIRAGHATPIVAKSSGEIHLIANSIDFDTLDEGAWQDVWSRICDVVMADIIPGLTRDEIELEVQRLVGAAA